MWCLLPYVRGLTCTKTRRNHWADTNAAQATEGTLHFIPPRSPSTPFLPPQAMANGSYKGNWESLYMRLLLVLAAIYDSTGSSDVGRRAEGEHAVSSEAFSVSRP